MQRDSQESQENDDEEIGIIWELFSWESAGRQEPHKAAAYRGTILRTVAFSALQCPGEGASHWGTKRRFQLCFTATARSSAFSNVHGEKS